MNLLFQPEPQALKVSNACLKIVDYSLKTPYLQSSMQPLFEKILFEMTLKQLYLTQNDARNPFI